MDKEREKLYTTEIQKLEKFWKNKEIRRNNKYKRGKVEWMDRKSRMKNLEQLKRMLKKPMHTGA